ncbi:PLC-like phosphodiesterase [Syncephalastrum racemosum]|uniref:PLC-like phosphodiesterase n=1 Tax=Syncephalastrum racemosum TaxID=13706 RepID=A0A1X2H9W0_SYNRA|nr:PLC-like phosphodiesterase [Syncephalastrum racemosum]
MKLQVLWALGSLFQGLLCQAAVETRQSAPVSSPPGPCNNFPQYLDLPINHYFWLGAHGAGAPCDASDRVGCTQDKTVTEMLTDGIRLIDLRLCSSSQGEIKVCSTTDKPGLTLHEVLDEVFDYARTQPQQVIMVHIASDGHQPLDSLDDIVDQVCKVHSERTEGTDVYARRECPYVYVPRSKPWETLGSLVNYDPDMVQWEGDGEEVGVRSKVILTHDDPRRSAYFIKKFWRSSPQQDAPDLNEQMQAICSTPGAVGLEAYTDNSSRCTAFSPKAWEKALLSDKACRLNESKMGTFLSTITVDFYQDHLPYLHDLQARALAVNYARYHGRDKAAMKLPASKLTIDKEENGAKHDEL